MSSRQDGSSEKEVCLLGGWEGFQGVVTWSWAWQAEPSVLGRAPESSISIRWCEVQMAPPGSSCHPVWREHGCPPSSHNGCSCVGIIEHHHFLAPLRGWLWPLLGGGSAKGEGGGDGRRSAATGLPSSPASVQGLEPSKGFLWLPPLIWECPGFANSQWPSRELVRTRKIATESWAAWPLSSFDTGLILWSPEGPARPGKLVPSSRTASPL